MTTLLYAIVPFAVTFFTWIVVKIFRHESRLDMAHDDIKDLKNLEVGKILSNHETRINELENDKKIYSEKLDSLTMVCHEIKGLLQSKKDKE